MKNVFYDLYRFSGSHREVGRQYGEALEKRIREHLERIVSDAAAMSGLSREEALGLASMYAPYIEKYAPGFQEELQGLAEGAKLAYEEALLLQVRQEVTHSRRFGLHPMECSCFAVGPEFTADGKTYSGQNADLIGNFEPMVNMVAMEVTGKPRVLMVLPAGQISHSGMNSEGISVNCNFLNCEGWGKGFPRYLMSRLALEQPTFEAACRAAEIPERSSQRNLLICDRYGHMRDYELTHRASAQLEGSGCMIHTNHFLAKEMQQYSAATSWEQEDSEVRYRRLWERMSTWKGKITPELLKEFLADHRDGEHSVCVHESRHNPYHTYVSMINHLEDSCMEVCRGNPCQNSFALYPL